MAGYSAVIFLFPRQVLNDLHDTVPWLEMIAVYVGIIDPYTYYAKKNVPKKYLQPAYDSFWLFKKRSLWNSTGDAIDRIENEYGNWFSLFGLPKSGTLHSPVFTFYGEASSGAVAVRLSFTHEGRHTSKELLVDDYIPKEGIFNVTVWLHSNSLYAWKNKYLLEVVYESWEIVSKQVTLTVEYERFSVGKQTLFLNTHLIPDDIADDIVRTAKDLEWNDTYYITYGCDPSTPKPPILIKDVVEYKVVPACLSFSLAKGYMLLFDYHTKTDNERLYTIDRGSLWVLGDYIPLYYSYFGRIFYSLVFYDPLTDQVSTLRARGDKEKNDLQLLVRHIPTKSIELQIDLYGWTQMQIVTRTEKMIFYLYKERDNKTSLIHPGTRFQYFRKSPGDRWNKVEEWQVYSLPVRIIAPGKVTKPTYTFDFTTNGNDIVMSDGVRRIDLKKNALRASMHDTQITSQYVNCAQVSFGAFGNLFGDQYTSYSVWNPVLLLASWLPESGVMLSYNDELQQFTPDQLFGWYLYHSLRYPNKWLHKWVNTYTLHVKNSRNNDMCTKQVTVVVE